MELSRLDKEQREALVEELETLQDSQAYQLVLDRLGQRLQRDQRSLAREVDPGQLRVLQGRVQVYGEMDTLIDDVVNELRNFHPEGEE